MKFWIILIILSFLALPQAFAQETDSSDHRAALDSERPGQDDGDQEVEAVTAHLSHFHQLPTRAQLESASDNAREIVFHIARDDDAFLFHRQRAIRALVHWADDEIHDFLLELLNDEATEDGLVHHILPVLAEGYGEDALEELEQFLRHGDDPHLRISAAYAISNIPGDAAHRLLVSAKETEDNAVVQRRLEKLTMQVR